MSIRGLAKGLSTVVGALVAIVAGLLIFTSGPQQILPTVADDDTLPIIALDDIRLHGRIIGPEGAPLVIVLHGGPGGDHRSLEALGDLSDTHRVLLFDQRGAGLSERVDPSTLKPADYLRDLDALVARFSPDAPVVLVGHSWGAMLATAYMGHAPNTVARAVLIEPGFLDTEGYSAWEAERARLSGTPKVLWTGLLAGFEARHVAGQDAAAEQDFIVGQVVHAFADHPDNPYHCPDQSYSAPGWRFGAMASDSFWQDPAPMIAMIEQGTKVDIPVLLMAGGCNDWTGTDLQTRHAAMFPSAQVITVDGAGHDVIWDRGDVALRHIRQFLK